MAATLLLADDSVTIQRVIELTFADEDVNVVAVGDGQRAIEWLDTHVPDAVLADVTVPGVDGYGLSEFVRRSERLRHVPVLLLAGAFEPLDDDRVRECGCDGVLVKPFEPQQLVTRVRELIRSGRVETSSGTGSPAAPTVAPSAVAASGEAASTTEPAPATAASREGEAAAPGGGRSEPAVSVAPASPAPAAGLPDAPGFVSLADAFVALLAAERTIASNRAVSAPSTSGVADALPAVPSETELEAAVRRVLVRMTDDLVRRLLTESAERLIKEEIARIRTNPG
jgi:CheY-like chemotaxis protein